MFLIGKLYHYISTILNVIRNFLDETNEYVRIPGFNHILNSGNHLLERITWILIIFTTYSGVYYTCNYQWNRFLANPTVIAMERDYRTWNLTLPAITLCYTQKIDLFRAEEILQDIWQINGTHEDFEYFMEFIIDVSNFAADKLENLLKYENDDRLQMLNLLNITKFIYPKPLHQISSFDSGGGGGTGATALAVNTIEIESKLLITEMGLCYVINAPIVRILEGDYREFDPITCNFNKQQCFLKIEVYDSAITITIHSPYDFPTFDAQSFTISKTDEYVGAYKIDETVTSPSLELLTIKQRKCLFYNELFHKDSELSGNLCLMKCRALTAMELCQCIPLFYPFIDGPECTVKGYICLHKWSWPKWSSKLCECPKSCTELIYSESNFHKRFWIVDDLPFRQMSTFRLEIVPSRMRYRRDVLFSLEDFIVSFGGAGSLFMGFSIWQFSKLIYMLIVKIFRMFRHIYYYYYNLNDLQKGNRHLNNQR